MVLVHLGILAMERPACFLGLVTSTMEAAILWQHVLLLQVSLSPQQWRLPSSGNICCFCTYPCHLNNGGCHPLTTCVVFAGILVTSTMEAVTLWLHVLHLQVSLSPQQWRLPSSGNMYSFAGIFATSTIEAFILWQHVLHL